MPRYFTGRYWRNLMDRGVGDLVKAVELLAGLGYVQCSLYGSHPAPKSLKI
jgi:hypothetical protein